MPVTFPLSGNSLNFLSCALGTIAKHHQDFLSSSASTSVKPDSFISNGLCPATTDANCSFSISSSLSYLQCSFLNNLILPCFSACLLLVPFTLSAATCVKSSVLTLLLSSTNTYSVQFPTHEVEDWEIDFFPIKLKLLPMFPTTPHKCQLVS